MLRALLLGMLLLVQTANGQEPNHQMFLLASAKTGIFISHDQFVRNAPIPLTRIQGDEGWADIKLLYSLQKGEPIVFHDRYGIKKSVSSSEIWGYCTGENIYINAGIGYSKLEIIGSISYFIADVMVERPDASATVSSGAAGFSSQPQYTYERQAVILDLVSGRMAESSPRNLEKMIAADTVLYTQFSALRNKDQQKQIIQVITDYNLRHPFYFAQ